MVWAAYVVMAHVVPVAAYRSMTHVAVVYTVLTHRFGLGGYERHSCGLYQYALHSRRDPL